MSQLKVESNATTANTTLQDKHPEIVEVWEHNFEEEMAKIHDLLEKYNYVAMDTEFPGVYVQGDHITGYTLIKSNVDILKLIQVGVTLADENGNCPSPVSTWQFNLRFDLTTDYHAADSIAMLKEAGINFEELAERGIDPYHFADEMISSGMVLNDDVHWITFHGAFDFAYFIKVLSNNKLPATLDKFKSLLKIYFPNVVDIKILLKEITDLKNGALTKLARDLDLKRIGTMHQAGSDAEITLRCFFKLKEQYFEDGIKDKLWNKVFGLAGEYQAPPALPPQTPVTQHHAAMPMAHDMPRMNMYNGYPHAQSMNYYGFTGNDLQSGYYFNHLELPMMYPAMTGNVQQKQADYNNPGYKF